LAWPWQTGAKAGLENLVEPGHRPDWPGIKHQYGYFLELHIYPHSVFVAQVIYKEFEWLVLFFFNFVVVDVVLGALIIDALI